MSSTRHQSQLCVNKLGSINPKSVCALQSLLINKKPARPTSPQFDPLSSWGLNSKSSRHLFGRQRTKSRSCQCQTSRQTSKVTTHEGAHLSSAKPSKSQPRLRTLAACTIELYRQKSLFPPLQVSQRWVEEDKPNHVVVVHIVGKSKRHQSPVTKTHVRRLVASLDQKTSRRTSCSLK